MNATLTIMINYHIAFVDNLQPIIDEMMYKKIELF